MADSSLQLPDDSGNTGKLVRTQTRSVGGDTVHEHYHVVVADVAVDDVTQEPKWAEINATSSGDTTLVSAVASKKIRVLAITFVCSAAVDVAFKSAGTTKIAAMAFDAKGGLDCNRAPHGYFVQGGTNEDFKINLSAAVNVRGSLNYIEVD